MAQRKPSVQTPLILEGDLVDVVAPGFRSKDEELSRGVEFLKKIGLTPRVSEPIFGNDLLCANDDKTRFQHLKSALQSSDSRLIWCLRAGYGAGRLLPDLYKLKKPRHKKLFIGYSDVTLIHHFLNTKWGWPSWHGPVLERLGMGRSPVNELEELVTLLFRGKSEILFDNLEPLNRAAVNGKTIKAPIWGGNMAVLQTLLGTPFMKSPKGKLLFFEDVGERGYRIDRMLNHFIQAGAFQGARGILFGTFTGGDEPQGGSKIEGVLMRFAEMMKIPVLRGLPVGHGAYQRVLPLHSQTTLYCGERPYLRAQL